MYIFTIQASLLSFIVMIFNVVLSLNQTVEQLEAEEMGTDLWKPFLVAVGASLMALPVPLFVQNSLAEEREESKVKQVNEQTPNSIADFKDSNDSRDKKGTGQIKKDQKKDKKEYQEKNSIGKSILPIATVLVFVTTGILTLWLTFSVELSNKLSFILNTYEEIEVAWTWIFAFVIGFFVLAELVVWKISCTALNNARFELGEIPEIPEEAA